MRQEERLNLRFRSRKEKEHRAWELVKNSNTFGFKSRNDFIVEAILQYKESKEQRDRDDVFLNRIREMLREELQSSPAVLLSGLLSMQPQAPTQPPSKESGTEADKEAQDEADNIALDFMNSM